MSASRIMVGIVLLDGAASAKIETVGRRRSSR